MGTITITVDINTYNLMQKLANEDEKTGQGLVEELVKNEDKKRHVKNLPYLGERRFKCVNEVF